MFLLLLLLVVFSLFKLSFFDVFRFVFNIIIIVACPMYILASYRCFYFYLLLNYWMDNVFYWVRFVNGDKFPNVLFISYSLLKPILSLSIVISKMIFIPWYYRINNWILFAIFTFSFWLALLTEFRTEITIWDVLLDNIIQMRIWQLNLLNLDPSSIMNLSTQWAPNIGFVCVCVCVRMAGWLVGWICI